MRAFLLTASAIIAVAAVACSGVGSGTSPLPAGGTQVHPLAVVTTGPNGYIEVTGTVTAVASAYFTLETGNGTGYVHIYTTSSTQYTGATPFKNENVDVIGTGSTSTSITATQVTQINATPTPSPTPTPPAGAFAAPTGVLVLTGKITQLWTGGFTQGSTQHGNMHVYTNSTPPPTIVGGKPGVNLWAQSTGPGTGSTFETASIVGLFTTPPPVVSTSGTIASRTAYGFTLNVNASSPSVPVAIDSSTKFPDGPVQSGQTVNVAGPGSLGVEIAATFVGVTSTPPPPTPSPTPNPNATPTPIALFEGDTVGLDNQFTPNDGDTASGGNGQTVSTPDGDLPCLGSMFDGGYHVHPYLGILVNGTQYAMPDGVGMDNPHESEGTTGITNYATCYYEMHTHDASGLLHVETGSSMALSDSAYTLGDFLQLWGQSLDTTHFGPYQGMVRIFYSGPVPLGTTSVGTFTEFTGDFNSIPLYSHEVIWLEVGPTYVLPPHLPAVHFYSEY